jgi:hypothetical protein
MMDHGIGSRTGSTRPSIELEIDELVLHGFAPGDRWRIGAAVERELGRLLSEQGLPTALAQVNERPVLNGGSFEVRPNARPDGIGVQVAHAIYGGFSK